MSNDVIFQANSEGQINLKSRDALVRTMMQPLHCMMTLEVT